MKYALLALIALVVSSLACASGGSRSSAGSVSAAPSKDKYAGTSTNVTFSVEFDQDNCLGEGQYITVRYSIEVPDGWSFPGMDMMPFEARFTIGSYDPKTQSLLLMEGSNPVSIALKQPLPWQLNKDMLAPVSTDGWRTFTGNAHFVKLDEVKEGDTLFCFKVMNEKIVLQVR